MSRRWRVAWAVLLVAASLGACSSEGDDEEGGAGSATSSSSSTASTGGSTSSSAAVRFQGCELGAVPEAGEITFVRAGQLLGVAPATGASPRCLADGASAAPQWNGLGDRVLFDRSLVLSKPTGKSVLRIADGRLLKRPQGGGAETDISFLDETESAVYHPRGEHVAAVGTRAETYGIHVATNTGDGARLVTIGEAATRFDQLTWTASGALLFVADHDGQHHLHRLELPSLALDEVSEVDGTISAVAASRFEGAGLAWTESFGGGCVLRVNRGGKVIAIPPSSAVSSRPVGWLPGGVLVLRQGCAGSASSGEVLTLDLSGTVPAVTVVAEGAEEVAVRAALPVGPGLDLDPVVESFAEA